jgi:hypothetical protein
MQKLWGVVVSNYPERPQVTAAATSIRARISDAAREAADRIIAGNEEQTNK